MSAYSFDKQLDTTIKMKDAALEVFKRYSENHPRSLDAIETYASSLKREMALRETQGFGETEKRKGFSDETEMKTVVEMLKHAQYVFDKRSPEGSELSLKASRVFEALGESVSALMVRSESAKRIYRDTYEQG